MMSCIQVNPRAAVRIVPILLLALAAGACRQQQAAPAELQISWLAPTDQTLLHAALLGYHGVEPKSLTVYDAGGGNEYPGDARFFRRCQGDVALVEIDTPALLAQHFGYGARRRFGSTPTLNDVTAFRNMVVITVFYGSKYSEEQASLAVSVGNVLYKPARVDRLEPKPLGCDEDDPAPWGLGALAYFERQSALPTSGRGILIVRRNSRPDAQFDIDFNSLK